ncbi:MAG: flagellar motor switch protein FliN [Candidatus Omnitrophica bacterium]|nr:flagellar motor switch protein FliN [Candidatus Omnitrophota bacterium]
MGTNVTSKDLKMIQQVNGEIAKKITKVFSTLLGKPVQMLFKEIRIDTLDNISAQLPQEALGFKYIVDHDAKAAGMRMFPKKLALLLAELLLGQDGKNPPAELSEQHIEALSHAFKKLLEAEGTAYAQLLSKKFVFELQEVKTITPSALLKEMDTKEQKVLGVTTIGVEGFFEETAYDVAPLTFVNAVLEMAALKISPQGGKVEGWNLGELKKEKTASAALNDISFLLDTPLHLTVEIGRAKLSLRDVLELGIGSIVELEKLAGEPVDIKVNNKLLAKGEVVVIDENFGVRIMNIISPHERV